MKKALPVLLCLILFASCATELKTVVPAAMPIPAPAAEETLAEKEESLQVCDDYHEKKAAVRSAAIEYTRTQYPGWQVKGAACFYQLDCTFFVDVDMSQDKKNQVIRLFVEPMFTNEGKSYWKAAPLSSLLVERTERQKNFQTASELESAKDNVHELQKR